MFKRASPLMFQRTLASQMKVIVGVKRVVDYNVKVRVKDNKVQTENAKMIVNPFDEIAIEEAVRLKEKKIATEVIAITIGNKKSEEVLRTALALGCDKAIHVVVPDADAAAGIEPLAVAKIFAKLHAELKPDLWILGKQAIDDDFGVTSQILASLIDAPQGTFASEVTIKDGKVTVNREIDAGRQIVELNLPAVVAADLRLNTPRFANLKMIMAARKAPIDVRQSAAFEVALTPRLTPTKIVEPDVRKAGSKVKTVEELFEKLTNEAKVI